MGDCILGTPPCTGFSTGEGCTRELPVDPTMQNINLHDAGFTPTQVVFYWTGGVGTVRLILRNMAQGGAVNDVQVPPFTDGTATMGNNLVVPFRFLLSYRCEEGGFCSNWKYFDFEFLGDVIPLFVDNGDYIIDGTLPYYIADGG